MAGRKVSQSRQVSSVSRKKFYGDGDSVSDVSEGFPKMYPTLYGEDWGAGEDYYIGIGSCKFKFFLGNFGPDQVLDHLAKTVQGVYRPIFSLFAIFSLYLQTYLAYI